MWFPGPGGRTRDRPLLESPVRSSATQTHCNPRISLDRPASRHAASPNLRACDPLLSRGEAGHRQVPHGDVHLRRPSRVLRDRPLHPRGGRLVLHRQRVPRRAGVADGEAVREDCEPAPGAGEPVREGPAEEHHGPRVAVQALHRGQGLRVGAAHRGANGGPLARVGDQPARAAHARGEALGGEERAVAVRGGDHGRVLCPGVQGEVVTRQRAVAPIQGCHTRP